MARGERFRAEIVRELDRKGMGEQAEGVLARLEARGLLDEFRAARVAAEARRGKRAVGDARLRAELEARGAPAEAIEDALAREAPESQRASELLAAQTGPRDRPERATRFLASRGFDRDTVESVVAARFGVDP